MSESEVKKSLFNKKKWNRFAKKVARVADTGSPEPIRIGRSKRSIVKEAEKRGWKKPKLKIRRGGYREYADILSGVMKRRVSAAKYLRTVRISAHKTKKKERKYYDE